MSLELTLTPKKIVLAVILILGGYAFSQAARNRLKRIPGGSTVVKVGDAMTTGVFVGTFIILVLVILLLSRLNSSINKKNKVK